MTNEDTIVQALTEARKTATDNSEMIAKATFSLNTDFFEAQGVTSSEDATQIVAGVLYERTKGLVFDYEIFGGDHGNYQICLKGNATRIAFVRRNQKGGGYTVSLADESKSIHMHNMPVNDQANEIMTLLQEDSSPNDLHEDLEAECDRYVKELSGDVYLEYTLHIKRYGKNKVTPFSYEEFKPILRSFYQFTVNAFTAGDLEKPDGTFWESSQHSFEAWQAHHGLNDRTASSIFGANDEVESYSQPGKLFSIQTRRY